VSAPRYKENNLEAGGAKTLVNTAYLGSLDSWSGKSAGYGRVGEGGKRAGEGGNVY